MAEVFRSSGVPIRLSLPPDPGRHTPVVVAVHGISRNSEEHLERLGTAASSDVAILAPHFDAEDFPHYQKLGLDLPERRADLWLDAALDALQAETGLGTGRFHLFGFSGGAQFAHRYALINPRRIRSLHLAAAGYYTFLDETVAWPRGLRGAPLGGQMAANRNFFLRIPIEVYVGDDDVERDPALRQGRAIDRQQGPDRRARALAWASHLRQLQAELDLPPAGMTVLAGVNHEFSQACTIGGLQHRLLGGMRLAAAPGTERDTASHGMPRPAPHQGPAPVDP